ncbi:MAG TPA: DnaA regulatory inactivator Hda [Gammaproteobacteria bacterium]|nr:DnaA regulatory inactivator Hda [Gammaproteobacteria bacterium]
MAETPRQLALDIGLRDSARFENYTAGDNHAALATLRAGTEPFVYLAGAPATGRTHLLQAACHAAGPMAASIYLPLREHGDLAPAVLEDLEQYRLVCLDDVDAVAGLAAWETALFHLYNRVREAGGRLIVSAAQVPAEAGFVLADLRSRLGWGPVFQLRALAEADRLGALQQRARYRGLDLPDEVGEYLLRRSPRDMASLFQLLERLDQASLQAQRRLTIPFVRSLLGS